MELRHFRTLVILLEVATLAVLSSVLLFQNLSDSPVYAPIVELVHGGKVRGVVSRADIDGDVLIYEGVPFGSAQRFSKSVLHPGWSGTWDATHPRDACPFLGLNKPEKRYTTKTYSEDCLYATVWKPSMPDGDKLRPVMVYIYGGGFDTGSVFKLTHDGRYVAARGDVIVVGFNYRVGPLGFLFGDSPDAPGNIGFWDQILALQWIQKNIQRFGGDPNKVTVFGNSAGSLSISILIHSPVSNLKLFHRAIMQSNGPILVMPKNESLALTRKLADGFHCDTRSNDAMLACFRQKSVEDILNTANNLGVVFPPTHDEVIIPVTIEEAIEKGNFNHDIEIMFGFVQNEAASWMNDLFPELMSDEINLTLSQTKQNIVKLLKSHNLENFTSEVIEIYTSDLSESSTPNELRERLVEIDTNLRFDCPEVLMIRKWARKWPMNKFWSYRVTQRPSFHVMGACTKDWMGVCHADELFYLFTIPDQKYESEKKLSHGMIRAWSTFARNGDPGWMSNVRWDEAFARNSFDGPIVNLTTRYMRLEYAKYEMIYGAYRETCETFWDGKLSNTF